MPEINEVQSKRTLNERARQLLKALVEHYIREGQPVGSRTLARVTGMELGPATIRNVMADLEDMGLVRSPHTSAGRIPTVSGYRFFVDSLLTVKALEQGVIEDLRAQLDPDKDLQTLVESASALLSDVT
ncbi:MAG: heat-inducible transcriptional repressor HrcA, partial [Gammaproteobacteria bacterium]|nr:heat-inducible transcriptional repressor HrcA [Gammaproteobacteria bacterium]